MKLPRMAKVRQLFDPETVADIAEEVSREFERNCVAHTIQEGQSVAVTVGSRGICNIAEITGAIVSELKKIGAAPFIVPSMGSHGGATAEGQCKLIEGLGVSEASMGVPVRSSMEVVEVGRTDDEIPVFIDRHAHEADHVFVVNRVKQHTDFEGVNESGLMKMMAIGLGKQKAADGYHNWFMTLGHYHVITTAARVMLQQCKISFGLGIVENELDQTAKLQVMAAADIEKSEQALLERAKSCLPKLPFDRIDLLIVDEIGKHFSGTGMDQNIIARTVIPYHVVPEFPVITRIFVRDLDVKSGGNGLGIGNADFTTSRFVEKFDRRVSYMNSFTAACPEIIRIPPWYESDEEVLEAVYKTLPVADVSSSRVVWISNTLHLEHMRISEAMMEEAEKLPGLEIVERPVEVGFDENNNLQNT